MAKKKSINNILKESAEHENGIEYHEHKIHSLSQEIKDRKLTKGQKEEIYYHHPILAGELEIYEV